MINFEQLKDNYEHINARIATACNRAGRSQDEITLLGVSKTIEPELVNQSIELGIKAIGENKPQEVKRKYNLITPNVEWHMIGHLQTNKVKMVIDKVKLIHSLDRKSLLDEIQKRAATLDIVVDTLIQVNIGDEVQKSGTDINEVKILIEQASACPNVRVKGLMCIAPYLMDPEEVRPYFKKMKNIFDTLKEIEYNNIEMRILSMGMTHDFEVAIEEGATLIRVGTGLYGARIY